MKTAGKVYTRDLTAKSPISLDFSVKRNGTMMEFHMGYFP
jgi:hypothetical protein